MSGVFLIIEGEPVGKGRARTVVRGSGRKAFAQHYTPEKTRTYEALVADEARKAMAGREPIPWPCRLELVMVCGVPDSWSKKKRAQALAGELFPSRFDLDNLVKSVADGFNGIVWVDDVQVVELLARKRYGDSPHVEAIITPLGGNP